ncbi:MAG: T9SS type A sorting domain-containing protein [bacterium]
MKFFIGILLGNIVFLSPIYPLELHNLELLQTITELDSTIVGSSFGCGLSSGDINGDGYSDIFVGGRMYSTIDTNIVIQYYVCGYYGGQSMDSIPDIIFLGPYDPGESFGHDIEIGDYNGDGYDDIAIGGGEVWVYLGGVSPDTICDFKLFGRNEGKLPPQMGDLNNDGYDDIIIGNPSLGPAGGRVDIYFGNSSCDTNQHITLNGEASLGWSLSSGYDVNNDGYEDLLVSDLNYGSMRGKAYIYYGGNSMDTIPDVEMLGNGGDFGEDVALLPDLNSDGFDDACIGIPFAYDTVLAYWGGNPMNNKKDIIFAGDAFPYPLGTYYGYTIAGIENVLSSGEKALVIGSCHYPAGCYNAKGKIYVYLGGISVDTITEAYAIGTDSLQQIGWTVANAGDVNGDGANEIMFSNYANDIYYKPNKVWVCKYTGPGIEEKSKSQILNPKLQISRNPFVQSTVINYQLPTKSKVSLRIYDATGRTIKTLVNEEKEAGSYNLILNAKGLSTGVYFMKFTAGTHKETQKLILIK